jgi:3-dehydroquinate synthase/2-deoxy-scyllo-inosose synthase
MRVNSITCRIAAANVPFYFQADDGRGFAPLIGAIQPDRIIALADETVWQLHRPRIEAAIPVGAKFDLLICPSAERQKTLASVEMLALQALERGATRRTLLMGIGGGVVGNLTGMTAGLLYRGIRFVHMPTTLLAMHDSVTSLKQGVNAAGKNILGLFHAPTAVLIDAAFLPTLPAAHLRAGMVELIKNALVLGGDVLTRTEPRLAAPESADQMLELIRQGITAKCKLLETDPFERGSAMVMEYGHTIGHAVELAHGGELNHGDSVAWGMRCAGWIAHELGFMSASTLAAQERLIGTFDPYPRPARPASLEAIMALIHRDNKRGYLPATEPQAVAMVLLAEIGRCVNADQLHPLTLVPAASVERALRRLLDSWSA